jgi:hypothetical protein
MEPVQNGLEKASQALSNASFHLHTPDVRESVLNISKAIDNAAHELSNVTVNGTMSSNHKFHHDVSFG